MHVRTLCLVLAGALALAGCASRTTGTAASPGGDVTAIASNGSVDLSSSDGILFLQSPQTGFIEAPPRSRTGTAPPARAPVAASGAGGMFSKARMWDRRSASAGGEAAAPAPAAPSSAPGRTALATHSGPDAPGAPRGVVVPGGDSPHITVRPARVARPEPERRATASLSRALRSTYENNPEINRARAELRALDEDIAIARSGNRPRVTASVSAGLETRRDESIGGRAGADRTDVNNPTTLALTVRQPLFDGFRTRNATREAEASVRAGRERLRDTRQGVLFDAVAAFLDVELNRELVRLADADIRFLRQQVEDSIARLEFGEGTRTDVNQAEARLAEVRAQRAAVRADLDAAEATFRRITGLEASGFSLDVNADGSIPPTLTAAVATALRNHPQVVGAVHDVDAAVFNVKETEGQLLPGVNLEGRLDTAFDDGQAGRRDSASVRLDVQIPIYQGGLASAQVRQAKEELGSARIAVDLARDRIRDQVVQAWTRYRAEQTAIEAARAAIAAARQAVEGVLEEQAVGQRTTLDVLNTQRDLVQAQVTLARARRNRRLAAFALLRAIGTLDVDTLGLPVELYDPEAHTAAVRDRWIGLRTPDGR